MVGGHGTSAAFGPILEAAGLEGGTAVAVASATFGLVAGCLIGGPIASSVIKKYDLKPTVNASGNEVEEEVAGTIDGGRFLNAVMFLLVALGIGTIIGKYLTLWTGISFPGYIGAMMAAAIIRNVFEIKNWDVPMEEINTIGGYSLSVFLGLAMMGLKLWQLADLAIPMIVMLIAQTVLMFVIARFVCFNILGRDYDAAVITSGLCGFGMGATPNAMANMQAVTKKNGPSPTAFLVVPLVGSLFIDFFNSTIITFMIGMFS
jgi:ESS family glutamate:Na+ symporter